MLQCWLVPTHIHTQLTSRVFQRRDVALDIQHMLLTNKCTSCIIQHVCIHDQLTMFWAFMYDCTDSSEQVEHASIICSTCVVKYTRPNWLCGQTIANAATSCKIHIHVHTVNVRYLLLKSRGMMGPQYHLRLVGQHQIWGTVYWDVCIRRFA